jgi:hypothetical protein
MNHGVAHSPGVGAGADECEERITISPIRATPPIQRLGQCLTFGQDELPLHHFRMRVQ